MCRLPLGVLLGEHMGPADALSRTQLLLWDKILAKRCILACLFATGSRSIAVASGLDHQLSPSCSVGSCMGGEDMRLGGSSNTNDSGTDSHDGLLQGLKIT